MKFPDAVAESIPTAPNKAVEPSYFKFLMQQPCRQHAFLQSAETRRGRKLSPDEALRLWRLYWRNRRNET